jgi:hypothetical protein
MRQSFSLLVGGLLCAHASFLTAQSFGGRSTYEFLKLSSAARLTGLGGVTAAFRDADLSMALSNPALLNPLMQHTVSFNQNFNPAGISFGNLGYAYHWDKPKTTFQAGLQYISYGKFTQTTPEGTIIGEAKAAEYAITLGAGKQLNERFSVGANLKTVLSYLGGYNSAGLCMDIAAAYVDTSKGFSATLLFKNMGAQLTTYSRQNNTESLPFDIQAAVSGKLKYLPLRVGFYAQQLHRWNLRYDNPALQQNNNLLADSSNTPSKFAIGVDNFFRHLGVNLELLLGKQENFQIRLGYNHLRGAELRVQNLRSLAGFSAGLGIKISKFRLDYGVGIYHFAGAAHHIGISTNISAWR